jgi:predicted MPP superfamily phosphohydrolase
MNINKKERTDGSSIFMMSLIEYNPDLFLLTGDYVDNVKKGEEVGYQNLEEWKIYNTTIRGLLIKKGFNVIEVSGNHDQWGVEC